MRVQSLLPAQNATRLLLNYIKEPEDVFLDLTVSCIVVGVILALIVPDYTVLEDLRYGDHAAIFSAGTTGKVLTVQEFEVRKYGNFEQSSILGVKEN